MKSYLNVGCGGRYHPAWTNIDIAPRSPEVIQHDVSKGIPLPDCSCDVVYNAAVFEHIRRADVPAFLYECHRVLKPGGIIRIGVPDLEVLCRLYLEKLEAALAGDNNAVHDYDWIMLELYDQTVRERAGGDMAKYLQLASIPNEEFVYERIGDEGRQLVKWFRRQYPPTQGSWVLAIKIRLRILQGQISSLPREFKTHILSLLLGAEGIHALEIGRFRLAGEVHQWMYDRYSLARSLRVAGFDDPIVQSATCSQIPDWMSFHLDTLADGSVIKPDLFFMEARKPC